MLARYIFIQKQIKNITNQLKKINYTKSDEIVSIGLMDRNIEKLAKVINETIDTRKSSETDKIKLENTLKQNIANMSHDLRTPLTSIKGYIQFLKLDDLNESERKEYLNLAEQRVKVLESLLNDFYELTLIDSTGFKICMEKIDIKRVIEEVLVGKYSDFESKEIKPVVKIPKEKIYIVADKKSLYRIIENLICNAIKYTEKDVNVVLKNEGNYTVLEISNIAKNLNQYDVEKIFDRFYMADKNRSSNGSGLGLSIVKELIVKMNGSVEADLSNDVLTVRCRFKKL